MTKIITSENRIIFDGHARTKEECETISLMCEELAKSDEFKTVKYESGYAEFEKVGKADELKFVPAPPQDATVIFDSHIISVNCPDSGGNWATSGTTVNGNYDEYLTYDVTLEDGYVIDTVVVNGTTPPESPVISNDGKSFYGILTSGDSFTVTITSKSTVSRKSIDLTTLPGWSSLSSGTHNITVVAKANGYRDSEPSTAVSVEKAPQEYTDCITFTGETSDFTLAVGGAKEWDGTVEYSTDHNTWTTWNGAAVSSVDKKLYLRGSGNTKFYTSKGARLSLSARAACSGNIQTLLEYSNPPTSITASYCYMHMFYDCTNLTTTPELTATTLTFGCYYFMFVRCTNLTIVPALRATTLASNCYHSMFSGCTNLTTAPALRATTLANSCYAEMFRDCTNLTIVPALPATTLASYCYNNMFSGCTAFKVSSTRTGTYQYEWRIPTSGTASTQTGWNNDMLSGTGGTFTSNPSINTTYYVENEPVSV